MQYSVKQLLQFLTKDSINLLLKTNYLNLIYMEFKRKFGRRRESKPKKGLFFILLLAFALILWFKAEDIMSALF